MAAPAAVLGPQQSWPAWAWATARSYWTWSWESKAASGALVVVAAYLAMAVLVSTDASIVAAALSTRTPFPMPALEPFVERREMLLIIDAIERGRDYLVVDGGNRVGKSVAVEVAASRLSRSRTVLGVGCKEGDTAAIVLRSLFGLDTAANTLVNVFAGLAKLSAPAAPSVATIERLLLAHRDASSGSLEPVMVVEEAEVLAVAELRALLRVAKVVVDRRRGRFVFLFSPTEKLDAIGDFGSLSRAKVIHVGDLSEREALEFIMGSGCDPAGAAALFALVGGHLPHLLLTDSVRDYCLGTLALPEVEAALVSDIDAQVEDVDRLLGAGSACAGLCGVLARTWPKPDVLGALLRKHLIVAVLKKGVRVESRLVGAFAAAKCGCGGGGVGVGVSVGVGVGVGVGGGSKAAVAQAAKAAATATAAAEAEAEAGAT